MLNYNIVNPRKRINLIFHLLLFNLKLINFYVINKKEFIHRTIFLRIYISQRTFRSIKKSKNWNNKCMNIEKNRKTKKNDYESVEILGRLVFEKFMFTKKTKEK